MQGEMFFPRILAELLIENYIFDFEISVHRTTLVDDNRGIKTSSK